MSNYTPKLKIKLIDEKEYFADEAFNAVIEDADNKLVGISHLSSAMHWDEWVANKAYNKNDIIRYKSLSGGQYAKCITSGISDKKEPTDNVTGSKIKDGTVEWSILSLADLLFDSTKIDIWLSSESYSRGQVVMYNNCLYRCKTPHTSSSTFDLDALKWQEIKASLSIWKPLTYYFVDDIVVEDNLLYVCITAHVSESTFNTTEETYWKVIGGAGGISVWQDNKSYNEGQLVSYNNILYKANSKHTSSASFTTDIANWDIVNAGLNSWATSVYYPAGIIVIANNKIYQCITAHTSTKFTADIANWQEISGYRVVIDDWKANTEYIVGDLCANDKKIYRCTIKHTSGTLFDNTEKANWEELSPTINEITDWKSSTSYNAKDIVINDNALYRCKTAHTSTSDFATDALTYWVKLSGANAVSVWASSKSYDEGQLVVYNNQLFRANASHASSATFDLDGAKWNMLESNIGEYKANVFYPIGTAVIYNNALFKCKVAHNSTSTFNRDNWTRIDSNNPLVKDWATSTYYYENDIVLYGNQLYRCNVNHTSSNFSADKANWKVIANNNLAYHTDTFYVAGSIVEYNGKFYRAKKDCTDVIFDMTNWELVSRSIEEWKAYDSRLISLINFEPGQYISVFNGKGSGLAFYDLGKRLNYYVAGGHPDSALNTGTDGYNSPYSVYASGGGFATTIIYTDDMDSYAGTKDFTFDFFAKTGTGDNLSIFGTSIPLGLTVNTWQHIACVYDYTSNSVDTWVDGKYLSNVAITGTSRISLWELSHYDNLRFREGKSYTAGDDFTVPEPSEFDYNKLRNYQYIIGDFVEHEGIIYKCIEAETDFYFDRNKWQHVGSVIPDWLPETYYYNYQMVLSNGLLYRCNNGHTSSTVFDVLEKANWDIVSNDDILIHEWATGTPYVKYAVVVYNNKLYWCLSDHTSATLFDNDLADGKWLLLTGGSSGGGGGSGLAYTQKTLMDVIAPKTFEFDIAETTDFNLAPVEVLKFKAGDSDVVQDVLTFDISDGTMFSVDGISSENSPYALYKDGRLYLATEYIYKHGSAVGCGSGYVTISDEIDLSNFKSVDSVEVV